MKMIAPALLLTLAACTTGDRPEPLPPGPRACAAEPVQRFVGQQATADLVEQVRTLSGSSVARRITPEMRVTMEFQADRVNVWVGLKGEAERITCG